MTDRLRDKIALVTGAGSGIGKAIVERFIDDAWPMRGNSK